PDALRVEHRQGAADVNPYLGIAATLGAGLWGIEHELEPAAAVRGEPGVGGPTLPRTLNEATELFAGSRAARELFAPALVAHFTSARRWQWESYRLAVTAWDLRLYFDSIGAAPLAEHLLMASWAFRTSTIFGVVVVRAAGDEALAAGITRAHV